MHITALWGYYSEFDPCLEAQQILIHPLINYQYLD